MKAFISLPNKWASVSIYFLCFLVYHVFPFKKEWLTNYPRTLHLSSKVCYLWQSHLSVGLISSLSIFSLSLFFSLLPLYCFLFLLSSSPPFLLSIYLSSCSCGWLISCFNSILNHPKKCTVSCLFFFFTCFKSGGDQATF